MGVMLEHGQPQRTASSENRMPQMGGRGSAPPSRAAPPHGTARVVPAAGNRRPNSFREAGHAVMKGGGVGITLSESIRNSGAALEEHEKQIRTLNTAMDGLRGQLESKDRDLQKLTATMNERVEGKDKQIEELRDNARASEMAIRGLEDEIRLLRKQNNEIDRAGRHGRNTNQPDRASPTSDAEAQKKLARAEEEAGALKKKVAALEAQLGVQRKDSKESDASGKALAAKLAALEKLVAEREKEIKALRAEIAALKTALAAAEQAAKSAGAGKAGADDVKDLCAKLKVAEERLAASVRDKEKVSADLDAARKQAETHKAAAAAATQSVATLESEMKALLAKLQRAEAEAAEVCAQLCSACGRGVSAVGKRLRG